MAQEIVDFSIIKQKIIKTDKILHMYQDTSHKLKKVVQAYKEIKSKYDQSALNINRLELENERCTFNLENVKLTQDKLEKENADLREQKSLLEDKYNFQTVQCQLEIKKLENELKNIQEVKITGNNIAKRKCVNGTSDDSDKRVKALNEEIKKFKENEIMYKNKIEELDLKNKKLAEEFKCFTNSRNYSEMSPNINQNINKNVNDLKRKIASLTLDKNRLIAVEEENEKLKNQLMNKELNVFDTCKKKSMSDFCTQTDIFSNSPKSSRVDKAIEQDTVLIKETENKEIYELKKKISSLICEKKKLKSIEEENEILKQKLMNQEITLFDVKKSKTVSDFGVQTSILPSLKKKSCFVQTLESIETYDLRETLLTENNNLKQGIADCEKQIIILNAELKLYQKQCFSKVTQTEDLDSECFEEILQEMCIPIPMMLSPMSPAYEEDDIQAPAQLSNIIPSEETENYELKLSSIVIPQVIVTPPTPTVENVVHFNSKDTFCATSKQENIINDNEKSDSKRCNSKLPYFHRVQRKKYRSPFIRNEFIKFRRSCCRTPIISNKEMLRRKKMKAKKVRNQDCILKALQTLKRSKINFTISNESILPKCRLNSCSNDCPLICSRINPSLVNTVESKTFIPPHKFKNAKHLTEKLFCNSPSCNKSSNYMLLSKRSDDAELLGFFDVKDESMTPSSSRIGNILENKPNFKSTINSLGNTEALLETLATMVSERLKEKADLNREVSSISNTNFESFNSETETELERLLEKPTKDILKRNRLLLKRARKNSRYHSTSSFEEKDSDNMRNEEAGTRFNESTKFDSNYSEEENTIIRKQSSTNIPEEYIEEKRNTSISKTTEMEVMDDATHDTHDSLKFSTCPELISPLSSGSKEMNTPPPNKCTIYSNISDKQNANAADLVNSHVFNLTEEYSSIFDPDKKIECENITYLCDSKNDENEIPNLDDNICFRKFSPNLSPGQSEESNNDNILHLKSFMNPFTCLSKPKEFVRKDVNVDSDLLNRSKLFDDPLTDSLEMQNLKHCKVEQDRDKILGFSTSSKFNSFFLENDHIHEQVNNVNTIESQYSVTDNKSSEEIFNAPQSPVQEQVEFFSPVIIPLEKVGNNSTRDFATANLSDTLDSSKSLDNFQLLSSYKPSISTNDHLKENEEMFPLSCNLNEISENKNIFAITKKEQEIDFIKQNMSTVTCNLRKENTKINQKIDEDVADEIKTNVESLNSIKGPVNTMAFCTTNKDNTCSISKTVEQTNDNESISGDQCIQNLSNKGIENTYQILTEYEDLANLSSYSLEDNTEHSFVNEKDIKLLTSIILNQIENSKDSEELKNEENEINSIPSCPQSPLNNISIDEINITPPKMIPLNNLRDQIPDVHVSSLPPQFNFSTEHEQRKINSESHLSDISTIHDEKTLPTYANSKLPQKLRRSERNLKRNKITVELTPEKDDVEECACVTNTDGCKSPVSEIEYKKRKITNEKTQPSQSMKNESPEMVIQVKRKRGRPRKKVPENTEFQQADPINHTEDNAAVENRSNEKAVQEEHKKDMYCLEGNLIISDVPLEENIEHLKYPIEPNPISENNMLPHDITSENEVDFPGSIPVDTLNITSKKEILAKGSHQNKLDKKPKLKMTKLKSAVLKQFKEKRKMFQTNVETKNFVENFKVCDLGSSNISKSKIDINVSTESSIILEKECTTKECDMKQESNLKRINIVQNILIPPNSNYAVDLLSGEENVNYEAVSKCDMLGNLSASSQSSKTVENSTIQKNETSVNNTPMKNKAKRKRNSNQSDILSKIMKDMSKGKPKVSAKPNKIKEDIPTSIVEKEWRKNILEIAEITHNVATDGTNTSNLLLSKHNSVQNPKDTITKKIEILLSRLVKLSSDEKIATEVILEFKRHDVETIAQIILHKVSRDIVDKADDKYYPAPLMTKTQRILLNLMVHLENENVEHLMDTFLTKAELFLFKIGCGIRAMVPITRLYVAVCRLRGNVTRLRTFCCHAFMFIGDLAIPLLFTVLTSWSEILPMESELKYYPITKILIQIVHLKGCIKQGYNLIPLRMLLHQFYGYPKERWNCDELFDELFQQYLRNPVPYDIAVQLLCKNKDSKWVYKKVNEFLKPLIYKIPAHNVNFKATVIILIGKICKQFRPNKELDETYLTDLQRWLNGLTEEDNVPDIIQRSVSVSLSMLPKKRLKGNNIKKRKRIVMNTIKKKALVDKNRKKKFKYFKRKKQ